MKLLHLEHVEDLIFDGEFMIAIDILGEVADSVCGKHSKSLQVSEKFDGAPAIVFGIHPENGLPFIGTKSVFNKRNPKICYNAIDVDKHYGDKPDLAEKIKWVSHSIHRFPAGVWQGDVMWVNDHELIDNCLEFTPNTITYKMSAGDPQYHNMAEATVGLVVHTKYTGDVLSEMDAVPSTREDLVEFSKMVGPEAYVIDHTYDLRRVLVLAEELRNDLMDRYKSIDMMHGLYRRAFSSIGDHSKTLRMFINYCVRMGEPYPTSAMYKVFLLNRGEQTLAEDVNEGGVLDTIFSIHQKMTQLKNMLIDIMSMNPQFVTEINGRAVKNEGFVLHYHGTSVKFVDRHEFSKLNFMNKKFEVA